MAQRCITRKKGKWFSPAGKRLRGGDEKRARKLAIPPAYSDVCVSPKAKSKLQGTAMDGNGKKHYYYHGDFTRQQTQKRLRRVKSIDRDAILKHTAKILRRGMGKEGTARWVAAAALRLVVLTGIRTSRRKGAESVGLLNLRAPHVRRSSGGRPVNLVFVGKSKQAQNLEIRDPVMRKALLDLRRRAARSSSTLFDVNRKDIVAVLSEAHGPGLKLKDLRTRLAIETFHARRKALKRQHPSWDAKKVDKEAVRHAAALLGHTPSVSKKYYLLA